MDNTTMKEDWKLELVLWLVVDFMPAELITPSILLTARRFHETAIVRLYQNPVNLRTQKGYKSFFACLNAKALLKGQSPELKAPLGKHVKEIYLGGDSHLWLSLEGRSKRQRFCDWQLLNALRLLHISYQPSDKWCKSLSRRGDQDAFLLLCRPQSILIPSERLTRVVRHLWHHGVMTRATRIVLQGEACTQSLRGPNPQRWSVQRLPWIANLHLELHFHTRRWDDNVDPKQVLQKLVEQFCLPIGDGPTEFQRVRSVTISGIGSLPWHLSGVGIYKIIGKKLFQMAQRAGKINVTSRPRFVRMRQRFKPRLPFPRGEDEQQWLDHIERLLFHAVAQSDPRANLWWRQCVSFQLASDAKHW